MTEEDREFIAEEIGVICRAFGITGAAAVGTGPQPGALEVLADAITAGNFTGGNGLGSSIQTAAETIAESINNLAKAVRLLQT